MAEDTSGHLYPVEIFATSDKERFLGLASLDRPEANLTTASQDDLSQLLKAHRNLPCYLLLLQNRHGSTERRNGYVPTFN